MSYLYIGFKGKNNPSNYIVNQLPGSHFFLTNSFSGIQKDIESLETTCENIILFGLNSKLKEEVQIEYCCEVDNERMTSNLDITKLKKTLSKFKMKNSYVPSHYLCNYAYYLLCKKFNSKVILLHIPFSKEYADEILQALSEDH